MDKQAIAEQARATLDELRALHRDDTVARLRAVSELANNQHDAANTLRKLRDEMALSLALHDGQRTVQNLIGVNRTRFYEMRCDALGMTDDERHAQWMRPNDGESTAARRARIAERARAAGVKHYPAKESLARLPRISAEVALADATATAARAERDDIVALLHHQGWETSDLAGVIGRSTTRIKRIKARGRVA